MKRLHDEISGLIFIAVVIGLFWVFDGSPDLWDKWHAEVMGDYGKTTTCK